MGWIQPTGQRLRLLMRGQPVTLLGTDAGASAPWPTPVAFSEGEYFKTADTSPPTKSGSSWTFTIPASTTPATPRRIECQWLNAATNPQYTDGQIARLDFTVVGQLGAPATTTAEDHWHVVCQLYGPSDDRTAIWDRFVKHGVKITRGKVFWYGGDAHPLHKWTAADSRAYEIPLADYADGSTYRIVVEAKMSDDPDGWISVWCNGVLWPVGERWRPQGQWNGAFNGNYVGVKYTHAADSYVSLRNGLYRGTNSAAADRPTTQQSVTVTPNYLTPSPAILPRLK